MSAKLFNQFQSKRFNPALRTPNTMNLNTIFRLGMYGMERKANSSNSRDIVVNVLLQAIHKETFSSLNQVSVFLAKQRSYGRVVPSILTVSRWLEKYEMDALGTSRVQSSQVLRKFSVKF